MLLYLALGIIFLVGVVAYGYSIDGRNWAQLATDKIKKLEDAYDLFLQKEEEAPRQKGFIEHATQHLQPILDELIQLLNESKTRNIQIDYPAKYFTNIIELCEQFFRKDRENMYKKLNASDVYQLKKELESAIEADFYHRQLKLS